MCLTNIYNMNIILRYIYSIVVASVLISCSIDEINVPTTTPDNSKVEFIARNTSFTGYNVSTKSTRTLTDDELTDIERRVASAFFMAFDHNGDRLVFRPLTVTGNSIPSQKLFSDYGDNNLTICFLANVPYEYANSLTHLDRLNDTPLSINYASYDDTGYMGIPLMKLDVKNTPSNPSDDEEVQCFPMFGLSSCSLSQLENNKMVINLKRLFAKMYVELKLALTDKPNEYQEDASFKIYDYTLTNLPKKVLLAEAKVRNEEDEVQIIESDWVSETENAYFEDPTTQDLVGSDVILYDNDKDPASKFSFTFYMPEYALLPEESEVEKYKNEESSKQQEAKPTLFAAGKRPIHLTINGLFHTPNNEDLILKYKVYLGENAFDSFSLFRNCRYDNHLVIKGTQGTWGSDNRVEVKYDGFIVGFQRAMLLDAHYEVRPLRVKFDDTFLLDIEEGRLGHGTVKVEIFELDADGKPTTAAPSWAAMERVISIPAGSNAYCNTSRKANNYPTKRKYFTTDLVNELLTSSSPNTGSIVEFPTDAKDFYSPDLWEDNNSNGIQDFKEQVDYRKNLKKVLEAETIIWLYVDEYSATSTSGYSADKSDVRRAQLKVTFTVDGETEGISKTYTFSQRPIYPIQTTRRVSGSYYTHGIEFFEEYLHEFDVPNKDHDNEESEGEDEEGSYDIGQTLQGLEWGLDGITLSRNKSALFIDTDNINPYVDKQQSNSDAATNIDEVLSAVGDVILRPTVSSYIETLPAYYDFYTSDDKEAIGDNGIIQEIDSRDFEGYEMNAEIIHTLLSENSQYSNVLLNQFPLNEIDPLSVIAYCYNKNKRDSGGNVVTLSSDKKTINTSSLHWYAPSIKELEEIIGLAYGKEEEFDVFTTDFYWSCQPAYANCKVDIDYSASGIWRHNTGSWFRPNYVNKKLVVRIDINGPYFQDDVERARSTMLNNGRPVLSSVDGVGFILDPKGTNDFGTYEGILEASTRELFHAAFLIDLRAATPEWTGSMTPRKTNNQLTYAPGNKPRVIPEGKENDEEYKNEILNRVRCIYNPAPPKSMTRKDDGTYTKNN